ncbi:MAG TPA: T9SS type A sorting domain-containing protein, partial [Bacteroidales bacterium]|nr:T9SS type A sorting domain-containing protein [Bacteroidales bacterium]
DTYHFRLGIDASVPTSGWETWMYFSGEDTWYYYGGTHVPIIRLSVGPYSGNTTIVSEDISVYPNPANDIVNLNNVEGANIQVVDITGKVLVNMNAAQNSVAVDMSAFAQGTYIIRILNENGLTVKKVNLVK